jgi:glycosyltransferase involved in cell wall biosynthesis
MKIAIFSHAPWAPSGYGQITHDLAIELDKLGYAVGCIAIDYHSTPQYFGKFPVFPTSPGIIYAPEDFYYWVHEVGFDIAIQLFDSWVIGEKWIREDIPILTYNPIDCTPPAKNFKLATAGAHVHVAMSEFAVQQMNKQEIFPYHFIPHAIHTKNFQPSNKKEARRRRGMPEDGFIFGLIGTNLTARKNIPNQMRAFAAFLQKNPSANAYLYLHTYGSREIVTSYDIFHLARQLKLCNRLLITSQQTIKLCNIEKPTMTDLYNCFDVLLSCSLGEGFCVPIIEAGSCGVPSIVTNFSAMPYTMGKGGLLINNGIMWVDSSSHGWQLIPSTSEIVTRMEELYYDRDKLESLSEKAKENAKKYDWNLWTKEWDYLIKTA